MKAADGTFLSAVLTAACMLLTFDVTLEVSGLLGDRLGYKYREESSFGSLEETGEHLFAVYHLAKRLRVRDHRTMLFRMSDDQKTTGEPAVIIAAPQAMNGETKGRLTKKHVVIGVIALLVTGLIVTGVLVGIKIYTDSNMEVLKYTLKANDMSQNVSVDGNSVLYHVKKDGAEAYIVQDFDKGIQVTKQIVGGRTTCYVTALNRSIAADASSIPDTTPDTTGAPSGQIIYSVLPDPITDLTFLGKKASTLCQNIPTYHAVPDCGKTQSWPADTSNSTAVDHRSKRGAVAVCSSYYYYGRWWPCVCGCCYRFCASVAVQCIKYFSTASRSYYCVFYTWGSWGYQYLGPYCNFNGVNYST